VVPATTTASLDEALSLLRDEPDAVVVAGTTDWGVDVNLRGKRAALAIAIERLPELRTLDIGDAGIEIGAALSLSDIERGLDGTVPMLAELFPRFASPLIRNRATIGGNLGTASPIGDTAPALLALEARVVLVSADGEREVDLSDYFTGYRETVRRSDELIRAVRIPLPLAGLSAFHKVAKRRFDDISSVAVGFALDLDDGVIAGARIGLAASRRPRSAPGPPRPCWSGDRGPSRRPETRHPCSARRAPRCPTIARVPSTARSCSARPC